MNIYGLHADLQRAIEAAEIMAAENGGEISDGLYEAIDRLELNIAEKRKQAFFAIKNIEAEALGIEAESKRLAMRAQSARKRADSIRGYLAFSIPYEGVKTPEFSAHWRKTEATVYAEDFDPCLLPAEYQNVKVTPKTAELKAAIKAGEKFDGVSVVENHTLVLR